MQKIKTVFKINRDSGLAFDEVVEDSLWYLDETAVATEKFDGRSAAVINGQLYVRYDRKIQDKFRHLVGKVEITPEMLKPIPSEGIPCEEHYDPKTGHHPFWVKPTEAWIVEAFEDFKQASSHPIEDGTYELVGPKVRCNVYNFDKHLFLRHGQTVLNVTDKSFEGIKSFLQSHPNIEGIVFQKHTPQGTLFAKVRRKDFGFEWNSAAEGIRAKRK